jgi:tRNA threonylcarbamoyladenosine biosynthesis protein TsaE
MSTDTRWQITVTTPEQTEALAAKIGQALKGDEVVELVSDLGGGKTTFVRGLVRGFGSSDKVASPTFTISKVYKAPPREVHHFDFYRLDEPGLMAEDIAEAVEDPNSVVVVEWADVVHHVLPETRLTIRFEPQAGANERRILLTCPASLAYLIEAAKN